MKTCSECGETKEESEFAKRTNQCKSCRAIYMLRFRASHRDEIRIYQRNYQRDYRITHREKRIAYNRKYNRQYRSEHREEILPKQRQYRLEHSDETSTYNRQYYRAHRDEAITYSQQYYQEHREEVATYQREYNQAHPDINRARIQRYRARKLGAAGHDYTTAEMIRARWEMFGSRCYLCGEEAEETDHVKPITKGGAHWPCNLRPICKSCNSSKGGKWPHIMIKGEKCL